MINEVINTYHAYMENAESLPEMMKEKGVFSHTVGLTGEDKKRKKVERNLTFHQNGTVSGEGLTNTPIIALDQIIEKIYSYAGKPQNLTQVSLHQLRELNRAVTEVQRACDNYWDL